MSESANPDSPASRACAVKILVVDDQDDLRENLCLFLSLEGYQTYEAGNGLEAFELAQQHEPDLILSDLVMSPWDGRRLIVELSKNDRLAHTPVVLLSAWTDQHNIDECLRLGALGYITKPFKLAQVARAIKQGLERGHHSDSPTRTASECE